MQGSIWRMVKVARPQRGATATAGFPTCRCFHECANG